MGRKIIIGGSVLGILVLIALIAIFLYNPMRGGVYPIVPVVNNSGVTLDGMQKVVDSNNKFAFDYYNRLKDNSENKGKNIFFSPYSISTALAMTYEGAREKTAEEMQSVFYFIEDDEERRTSYAGLYSEINKKDKEYKLSTANALWAEKDYKFLDEYFNTITQFYGGKITNLDFKTETEKSRKIINSWVEDQTNDKIKNLIPEGMMDPMTRLVLTNAIYFKGDWVFEFDKDLTKNDDFKIGSGGIVKVPMMARTDEDAIFNYGETEDLQVLEMMYKGEELSMLVFLPQEDNLENLENIFSAEKLVEWKNSLKKENVKVFMPKFKFETKYFMAGDLSDMGMPTAFSSNADFSGMDGTNNLYIDSVIHQAFVDVNEEGTEAAAATAVIMRELSAMPERVPIFRADHPFIFAIQHRESGEILFIGRVINPGE